MDRDVFWSLIEEARARSADRADDYGEGSPLPVALVDVLAERLSPEAILAFSETSDEISGEADRWDLVAACYLIERHVSDDHFSDFRDGLILLGGTPSREPSRTLTHLPITQGSRLSAQHARGPACQGAMGTAPTVRFGGRVEVAYESITNLTIDAWTRLTGREEEGQWEALMRRRAEADASDHPRRRADYADRCDLAVAVECGRRLPRLVGLLSIPQPT